MNKKKKLKLLATLRINKGRGRPGKPYRDPDAENVEKLDKLYKQRYMEPGSDVTHDLIKMRKNILGTGRGIPERTDKYSKYLKAKKKEKKIRKPRPSQY